MDKREQMCRLVSLFQFFDVGLQISQLKQNIQIAIQRTLVQDSISTIQKAMQYEEQFSIIEGIFTVFNCKIDCIL